ncbi:MAG: sigma-70 family RNA polymerase sigma factor [Pseudomonadota bacterium]|nr:sigma-70 family RNA polymerase sigma factor [Pseudomonadota bacterium]
MNTAVACTPAFLATPPAVGALPVSWAEMVSHRAYLVRYAQRKLRDPMLAEDAVHDVFEAVLNGRAAFAGRAALRSWLTAVLKHKIVDAVRRHARFESLDDEAADDRGAAATPCPQPGPDRIAEQRQLLARTLDRIDSLPASLRDAVRLRVLEEQSTAAVCKALGITEDNLFVRMHRARKQLLS